MKRKKLMETFIAYAAVSLAVLGFLAFVGSRSHASQYEASRMCGYGYQQYCGR